jgi:pyruvate,water dikinase
MSIDRAEEQAGPAPLPTPANFPVRWKQPGDERLFWARATYHAPDVMKVGDFALFERIVPAGNSGLAAYGVPARQAYQRINGYVYASLWLTTDDPAALDRQIGQAQETLEQAMAHQEETWRTTYLPELEAHLAFWDGFDPDGATMPRLLAHLDETLARWDRIWGEFHVLVLTPAFVAVATFDEFYRGLFGSEDAYAAYRLLQGFGNKTVERGHGLWRLSRWALAQPEVCRALNAGGASAVLAALEQSGTGREFLAEWRTFLRTYGRRSERLEASQPSWREDPTPVLKALKDDLGQPARDLEAELAALEAERDSAVAAARAQLRGYSQAVRERFEFLLAAAQVGNLLLDDHQCWIDVDSLYYVRQVLMEFGRRFAAAGVLAATEDVFHLTLEEVRETAEALPRSDRRKLVGARAAEIAYFRTIPAPTVLGTPPTRLLPDTPFFNGLAKYVGVPSDEAGDVERTAWIISGWASLVMTLAPAWATRRRA